MRQHRTSPATADPATSPATADPDVGPAPNHHAAHPGFSGVGGLVAAVSFLFGRDDAARLAIDLAELRSGDRLVDVGCGPGIAVERARAVGAEVIGVDPAAVMLRVARARWRSDPRVDWRLGTAEALPVDDRWAEVVWSLSTVHHWADVDLGIAEASRSLAPAGRFVAVERCIGDTAASGTASHGWTPAQADRFAQMCADHGFVDVHVEKHGGSSGSKLSVVAHKPA